MIRSMSLALSLMALASQAQAAPLTVNQSDVVNKVREITLQAVSLSGGNATILADGRGISVYTFDLDAPGVSNCKGGCLTEWPTLTVDASEVLPAPFGKIQGNDGRLQLTLNGMPLYYYNDDQKPGDVFGDYPKWHPVVVTQ